MIPKTEQIKTKVERVRDILTRLPETRSDDRELVVNYWRVEQPMLFAFRNAEAVLRALVNKDLSNPDDITRTRRLVQKQHPELRASKAVERQRYNAEADVRENINKPLP